MSRKMMDYSWLTTASLHYIQCVCVRQRDRETERDKERKKEKLFVGDTGLCVSHPFWQLCKLIPIVALQGWEVSVSVCGEEVRVYSWRKPAWLNPLYSLLIHVLVGDCSYITLHLFWICELSWKFYFWNVKEFLEKKTTPAALQYTVSKKHSVSC